MSMELIAGLIAGFIVTLVVGFIVYKRLPKKLKTDYYGERWKDIQGYCKDKSSWSQALVDADSLLDHVLKRRKFKGKTVGERLVSAQRLLTNNDGLWFAHNLYKKVVAEPTMKLKEADMKAALVAYRQALRDLGALDNGQPKDS